MPKPKKESPLYRFGEGKSLPHQKTSPLEQRFNLGERGKEYRTRKSELTKEHGRQIGKAKLHLEYAGEGRSARQTERIAKKALKKTVQEHQEMLARDKTKELELKGIETTRRGYAKRRQTTGHSSYRFYKTGEEATKTVKRYTKEGVLKREKKKIVLSISDEEHGEKYKPYTAGKKRVEKTKYRKGIDKPLPKHSIRPMISGGNIGAAVVTGMGAAFGGLLLGYKTPKERKKFKPLKIGSGYPGAGTPGHI